MDGVALGLGVGFDTGASVGVPGVGVGAEEGVTVLGDAEGGALGSAVVGIVVACETEG